MPKPSGLSQEKYDRLRAEAKAPYRGLRQFVYLGLGASAFIGALVFLARLAAGQASVATTLPNLALQLGVVALMWSLLRWENRTAAKR